MTEFWVEVNIIPMNRPTEYVLATAIKSIVDHFRDKIETWHFLRQFEPIKKNHIRFRVRTQNEQQLDEVRAKIETILTPLKGNEIEDFYYGVHGTKTTDMYEGQDEEFGVRGWQIMQKLMEHTSNAVIEMIIKSPEKSTEWYAQRSIHFLLNQTGFNYLEEANFHHNMSIGYLLVANEVIQTINEHKSLKEKYYKRFPDDK